MPAAKYDLIIEEGAKFELDITWTDNSGTAIDLTGLSARLRMKRNKTDATTLAEWTSDAGDITIGGSAGTIAVSIGADITAGLDWYDFKPYYNLEVYDALDSSNVTRLLEGRIKYSRDI